MLIIKKKSLSWEKRSTSWKTNVTSKQFKELQEKQTVKLIDSYIGKYIQDFREGNKTQKLLSKKKNVINLTTLKLRAHNQKTQ
jgi:hypothetical protein